MALIVIDVVTSSSGMPSQQTAHVLDAVDRDAGLADLALGARVVRVVAHLRRQVERDRQAGLAVVQQVAESRVRLRGGSHAGVLPHRPDAPAVHRRVDAAGERRAARFAEVARLVVPLQVGRVVRRADLDAGVGQPVVVAVAHGSPAYRSRRGPVGCLPWTRTSTSPSPATRTTSAGCSLRHDEPVLLEMEAEARETRVPRVGRMVGVVAGDPGPLDRRQAGVRAGLGLRLLGVLVRASRRRRRRGAPHGVRPEEHRKAHDYLGRAGLARSVPFHVG